MFLQYLLMKKEWKSNNVYHVIILKYPKIISSRFIQKILISSCQEKSVSSSLYLVTCFICIVLKNLILEKFSLSKTTKVLCTTLLLLHYKLDTNADEIKILWNILSFKSFFLFYHILLVNKGIKIKKCKQKLLLHF